MKPPSEESSFTVSTSLKNETEHHEDSPFSVPTSLKNELDPFEESLFPVSTSFTKMKQYPLHFKSSLLAYEPSFPPLSEWDEAWGGCLQTLIIMLGAHYRPLAIILGQTFNHHDKGWAQFIIFKLIKNETP